MIELLSNALYTEDELVVGLGCTKAWLRRRVGGLLAGRVRLYRGAAVLAKMRPCAPSEATESRLTLNEQLKRHEKERQAAQQPSQESHRVLERRIEERERRRRS